MSIRNLLLLIFVLSVSVAAVEEVEEWRQSYRRGLEYLRQDSLARAESEFKAILEREKVAEVYVALGRVYERQEPGSRKARRQFESALRKNRKCAPALYWLGINYEHQPNKMIKARDYYKRAVYRDPSFVAAWLRLARAEEELDQVSEAVKAYCKAFYNNPGDPDLHRLFLDSVLKFHGAKEAKKILLKLIEEKAEPQFRLDLAEMLYELGDYRESIKELGRLRAESPQFQSSKLFLIIAKTYFAVGDNAAGLSNYWSAVRSIADSSDADAIFHDLQYLMRQKEYDEYIRLNVKDIPAFLQRFWKSRDPDKSTPANERLVEHYARLRAVLKNNRRYTRGYSVNEFLYESLHPFQGFNTQGNKLLAEADFPREILENRNIDDMGLIFLRHGPADQKVTSVDGIPDYVTASQALDEFNRRSPAQRRQERLTRVPKPYMGESLFLPGYQDNLPINVSWKYFATQDQPEMMFHFKLYGGHTSWIVEAIPYTFANREELDPRFVAIGREAFESTPDAATMSQYATEIAEQSSENVRAALSTERSNVQLDGEGMSLPIQLLTFKGKEDLNSIFLFYGISGKETELDTMSGKPVLPLETFLGLYDTTWASVVERQQVKKYALSSPEEWPGQTLVDKVQVEAGAGDYYFEIHVRNRPANRHAAYKGRYNVPDYDADTLMISDILLSQKIRPRQDEKDFVMGEIAYNPNMFRPYKIGDLIGLYFEVYNLRQDNDGGTRFSVDCAIKSGGAEKDSPVRALRGYFGKIFGQSSPEVATSYTYNGQSADDKIYINLDPGKIDPGQYQLRITVTDDIAGTSRTRTVPVTMISKE